MTGSHDGRPHGTRSQGTGLDGTRSHGTRLDGGGRGRTVSNAPWRLWAWPYGAAVLVLTLLWMLLPLGVLWMAIALVAGVLIARRTVATHPVAPLTPPVRSHERTAR